MHLPRIEVETLATLSDALIADVIDAMTDHGCVRITQTGSRVGHVEALAPLGRLFGGPVHHKLSDAHGIHPIRFMPGYPEDANAVNGDLLLHDFHLKQRCCCFWNSYACMHFMSMFKGISNGFWW